MSEISEDFNVFQSLWSNINDVCSPAPPPGSAAVSCFLMEMPGFSVDPKAFDPKAFKEEELEGTLISPDCAVARLCDRVPALARYFYDTGDKISFYWNQLCTTYGSTAPETPRLRERYDSAIKALYGSQEGYINQTKTKLFQNLETLRSAWEEKQHKVHEFKIECRKDKKNWPANFENDVGPLRDASDQAHAEYYNVKMEIKHHEAAIYAYETGDLNTLMFETSAKWV